MPSEIFETNGMPRSVLVVRVADPLSAADIDALTGVLNPVAQVPGPTYILLDFTQFNIGSLLSGNLALLDKFAMPNLEDHRMSRVAVVGGGLPVELALRLYARTLGSDQGILRAFDDEQRALAWLVT